MHDWRLMRDMCVTQKARCDALRKCLPRSFELLSYEAHYHHLNKPLKIRRERDYVIDLAKKLLLGL